MARPMQEESDVTVFTTVAPGEARSGGRNPKPDNEPGARPPQTTPIHQLLGQQKNK
jgi:hypothetical protein